MNLKAIALFCFMLSLSACSLFGGGTQPSTGGSSGGGVVLGTFHPGPYTDPSTGKTCGDPGGFCDDDGACHSSADKCHKH